MSDISEFMRCINFAAIKHKDQRRKDPDKTPYINHPIGVAHILTHEAGVTDLSVLCAALLHDTVEDTDTSFEELEQEFGPKISNIVREVTDDKTKPKLVRKQEQIEHAVGSSYEAKLVKLADKIYNLRDLSRVAPEGWSQHRVQEYFQWAEQVVGGLRGVNQVMEQELDSIFKANGVMSR